MTFGLFLAPPPGDIVTTSSDYGFVDPTSPSYVPPLFTCTSDTDGDCVFSAADGGILVRPGAAAADGVPQGTRLWAAPISEATGDYFANPWWQTAPLTNTNLVSFRHTFETPPLVAGGTYLSGRDWITNPALSTSPATPSSPSGGVTEANRRLASTGEWALSRVNVPFVDQCGMNVALVVDVSSSISQSGAQGDLVNVMDSFVDALRGTPSSVALFSFGSDSPANGFAQNSPLQSVATTADADAFKARYASWATLSPWPTNYTNWDRGFEAAANANGAPGTPSHFDLALFITDGNPTVYGASPTTSFGSLRDPSSGYTRFVELGDGLASANLLKSQDTRVLAVGVGGGLSAEGAAYNLRTISGRDAYTTAVPAPPGSTDDLLEADYIQTPDWDVAAQAMRDLVLRACAPTISVVKRVVPFGGTIDDAIIPPAPWRFDASTTTPSVSVDPTSATTDPATGGVSFGVEFGDPTQSPATIRIAEDLAAQPGYTAMPEETTCVERSTGSDEPVTVTPDSADPDTAFSVPLGVDEMVTCVVYNQAPADVIPAQVVVHKMWEVHTADQVMTVPDGSQPAGLGAGLRLTGPQFTAATPQPWSVPRGGYDVGPGASPMASTVTFGETVVISPQLPLCTVDPVGAQVKPGAPDGTGTYVPLTGGRLENQPLVAGTNEWTILNTIDCESRLTLVKDVANGPLMTQPELWTLTATGPDGVPGIPASFSGSSGSPGVTDVVVAPNAPYQLAESIPTPIPDHYMQHYRQPDLRTEPLLFPDSSGSWACHPADDPTGDPSLGAEGAVIVPLGMRYECVVVNTTSFLTVTKTVVGGSATPADFTFRVAALPPVVVPDPLVHDFGSGVEQSLVPEQDYALTELAGPADYALESMACTSGGIPFDPASFSILTGAEAECTATNVFAPPPSPSPEPSPEPTSEPSTPPGALPPTGMAMPGWVMPAALALVLAGAAATFVALRDRRRTR